MSPEKEKHRSKSDKKSKSSTHSEKKRKRDQGEDGSSSKTKSKKHKSDKHSSHATSSAPQPTADKSNSPFHLQTSSLYLPLAPVSQKFPLEGLCAEHLSPLLLTYYPPFRGVLLSYSNPRLSETPFGAETTSQVLLQNIDEYAVSWTWLTADFLLFKPERGVELEGYVNLQNEGHLGVVCWNLFNASIERKRLPRDWVWRDVSELEGEGVGGNEGYAEDGQGCWVDGEGKKVEGMIRFRVKEIESSHDRERGFLSIEGTMLDDDEEREMILAEREGRSGEKAKDKAGRRLGGDRALGATSLGVQSEESQEKERGGGFKHRTKY
ncbi:related to dna-dependent rna polymerase I subunit a43 (rpa43) [Phialocephala subalpina]|uniref:DNA-directed RNA polymerase subunit n=1 Tax=Phialocephala subalpina TaxID=576137 RepID=A0A1L7WKR2_9HELO|nr:related to dna-dependent rna polymerase I subunit a43 (rpa43) [Phialocephala subalpina]